MEINRPYKSTPVTAPEKPAATRETASDETRAGSARGLPNGELSLGQLQEALRTMPDVDLAKVEQIKQALQRGEIPLDTQQLARSVLAYHRGGDV